LKQQNERIRKDTGKRQILLLRGRPDDSVEGKHLQLRMGGKGRAVTEQEGREQNKEKKRRNPAYGRVPED